MKPLSGLSLARCAFCFFASSAIATESVRGFTTTPPPDVSPVRAESWQSRWSKTERVAHPGRRSLDGPPAAAGRPGTHLPVAAALAEHSVSARAPVGRRETEYMSATSEETATVSSKTAISNSPITKPRRARCAGLPSAGTSIPPSCRPRCYAELPAHPSWSWPSQLRRNCSCTAWYRWRLKDQCRLDDKFRSWCSTH